MQQVYIRTLTTGLSLIQYIRYLRFVYFLIKHCIPPGITYHLELPSKSSRGLTSMTCVKMSWAKHSDNNIFWSTCFDQHHLLWLLWKFLTNTKCIILFQLVKEMTSVGQMSIAVFYLGSFTAVCMAAY